MDRIIPEGSLLCQIPRPPGNDTVLLRVIEDNLLSFRSCFSRRASFHWFVLVVVGFMLRGDQLGVTSIIRDLSLMPACYELLIHFFHSDAWEPACIRKKWYSFLASKASRWKVNGKTVLAGDGVKQYKEAFYMAGVKKLFQESENISKPEHRNKSQDQLYRL